MPISPIPPNLSTSQYQQLVLELLNTIGGPGSLDIQPPILSTSDYRHLVLYALNYIATNGTEPAGPAGGDLTGTYPNPTIKANVSLTGVPLAPTATAGDSSTQIATTAFVQAAVTGGTGDADHLIATVVNADSVALVRGTVVYAFGSVGNKLSVKRADNTSDATSATTIGFIRDTNLAPNAQGTITLYGSMDQLNLGSPFIDGDPIYLGTSGGYQRAKPVAPAHSVFLGVVERANAGNGIAYVKIQNGYELDELHDVLISSETAGQALVRNAGNTLWINKTLAVADVSGAAAIASPTFTGTPLAPTAADGTNSTQIATTAFTRASLLGSTGTFALESNGATMQVFTGNGGVAALNGNFMRIRIVNTLNSYAQCNFFGGNGGPLFSNNGGFGGGNISYSDAWQFLFVMYRPSATTNCSVDFRITANSSTPTYTVPNTEVSCGWKMTAVTGNTATFQAFTCNGTTVTQATAITGQTINDMIWCRAICNGTNIVFSYYRQGSGWITIGTVAKPTTAVALVRVQLVLINDGVTASPTTDVTIGKCIAYPTYW